MGVKTIVCVTEHLVEVADTHRDLVGHRRGNDAVVDDGVVLNVDWSVFEVWCQCRSGWGSLCSLCDEPSGREVVFIGDFIIQLDEPIETVAGQVACGLIVIRRGFSVECCGRP